MKRIEKFYIAAILLSIPLIVYLIIFSRGGTYQFKKLDNEGVLDTAVIIREFTGAKRRLYLEYVFNVENKKYNGFLQYSPSHGQVEIGDSILVQYLKDNPDDINKLQTDTSYKLIKIK